MDAPASPVYIEALTPQGWSLSHTTTTLTLKRRLCASLSHTALPWLMMHVPAAAYLVHTQRAAWSGAAPARLALPPTSCGDTVVLRGMQSVANGGWRIACSRDADGAARPSDCAVRVAELAVRSKYSTTIAVALVNNPAHRRCRSGGRRVGRCCSRRRRPQAGAASADVWFALASLQSRRKELWLLLEGILEANRCGTDGRAFVLRCIAATGHMPRSGLVVCDAFGRPASVDYMVNVAAWCMGRCPTDVVARCTWHCPADGGRRTTGTLPPSCRFGGANWVMLLSSCTLEPRWRGAEWQRHILECALLALEDATERRPICRFAAIDAALGERACVTVILVRDGMGMATVVIAPHTCARVAPRDARYALISL